ncbi:Putative aminopeptidase FrvX [Mycolicibacterium rutilum]|uniref:Putative aminopeptidase FrvX n=1 Tax=Mycolicibacterium rutilum TaxID=370526 RepID=A0A1H6IXE9_MYCRU|nr:peptidase M42 [Mycolicibacterium rutilum]SEH52908.1 Putative aminopeptidase FrvX [Mycolicibacterium rutilum]
MTAENAFPDDLLQELLHAYGPCGQEDAVREVCRRELAPHTDELWTDEAGNLVGLIRGDDGDAPPTRVLAHMDELSMLVKRVEPDGTLHMTPLGTMYPGNFGLGPVAILGDQRTVCGVLTLGSEHTTKETRQIWETKPDQGDMALDWLHVYVFTGHTPEELADAGVGPGTRACVHRSKRTLVDVGADYLGCYFMDDRAALVALLETARVLSEGARPARDTYVVCTTSEEVGGVGGSYASRMLPGDLTLALEVGPAEQEYGTSCSGGPIVAYSDAESVYDKAVADRLIGVGTELGLSPQRAVLGAFESDASHAKASGLTPRAGLLCLPTLSTHGYEVIARHAIPDMTRVLVEFLRRAA